MIKSMTGYGKAQAQCGDMLVSFEVKSLNGKLLDAAVKLPSRFKELELEVRNIFSQRLLRGKVDCLVTVEKNTETNSERIINKEAFVKIYSELKTLAQSVGADITNLTTYVLNLPEVKESEPSVLTQEEKEKFADLAEEAVSLLDGFRICEGKILMADLEKRISLIADQLAEIEKYEADRCVRIKERIVSKLNELSQAKADENRLEQEMIYYLEKLDITEEKVRLRQHLDYFLQTLDTEEGQGKKLGFIAQEMGREINTLGSKANDADMQVLVVKMKDELEKIKEQVANVL